MAFSEAQRVQLRKWLGYASAHRQINTWLESAFDLVGGYPDSQTEVESILAKLALVDPKVDASMTTAGLKMVGRGKAEWFPNGAVMTSVGNVGRLYCQRLATIFGVEIGDDAFSGGAPMGAPFQVG